MQMDEVKAIPISKTAFIMNTMTIQIERMKEITLFDRHIMMLQ